MFFYLYTFIFGNLYLVVRRPMLKYMKKKNRMARGSASDMTEHHDVRHDRTS